MIRIWNQLSTPRIIQVVPDCLQIRGHIVHHFALLEEDSVTLVDGGFLCCRPAATLRLLASLGRQPEDIRAILLTHGHIDHTLNLKEWKELTGAPLFAPRLDTDHIGGTRSYRGWSRVCGGFEFMGRQLLSYEPPEVDCWFEQGDLLPFWGGLEVIGLPGHTPGHSGFYSRSRELLFAGDLFASWFDHPHLPPAFLNSDSAMVRNSAEKAAHLPLSGGVLLNHADGSSPARFRQHLETLTNH